MSEEKLTSTAVAGGIVALAEHIARKAHANQFRRDRVTPYITHPEAVVKKLAAEVDFVRAAGWLHDVLEDTDVTQAALLHFGVPNPVVDAVALLTKTGDCSYEAYLEGVRENEIARRVKIADMLHNLSDSPTQKQILKYARGLVFLLERQA